MDAVVSKLTSEGVRFDGSELSVAAATDAAAQVVAERAGSRLFSAHVKKIGDSWYVTEFWACTGWISGGEQ